LPDGSLAGSGGYAAARAARNLVLRQGADGSWEGEVVWCPIITAQVVIVDIATGRTISAERRRLIARHFAATRCPDGGWGLHPESSSYLFVTTLVYVAARLIGETPDGPLLRPARAWLTAQPDGIRSLPQWGKIWLSLIGLYDRQGLNPCPPELFLLPHWLPGAPTRLYCHTRYIYLGIAYLVGSGFQADLGPIAEALRRELYGDAGAAHDAACHRHDLATSDAYVRPGRGLVLAYDAAHRLGALWRRLPGSARLRRRALDTCLERIRFEQRASRYQGISPVSGVLNTLALSAREPESADAVASRDGIERWLWQDEAEGARYAGARSTTWDTSFALQALAAGIGLTPQGRDAMRRGYCRLAEMQECEELPRGNAQRRDPILGGWCFSDGAHRWPVSDCTSEALIAILACHGVPDLITPEHRIPTDRLRAAAGFILSRQNRDGGFGTYERRRGGRLVERLNPSEMFGQCMTELSYLECTASAIRALQLFVRAGLAEDPAPALQAVGSAVKLVLSRQREDGSWSGFWGINFVYGTLFAVTALRCAGLKAQDPALDRAHRWLRSVQQKDGGWGEHFTGCLAGRYVASPNSLVITTAWAVLALLEIEAEPSEATRRGVDWLLAHQDPTGDWPRDSVNGVFFGTAMLDYRLYNTYFPTWALARFEACRDAAER
jgi:squalene/oxidosqualene cyclase-like protein